MPFSLSSVQCLRNELHSLQAMSAPIKNILLIVPCYNEEKNIPLFVAEAVRHLTDFNWKILFVNDGSTDASWDVIQDAHKNDSRVHGICLARNFGHQNALKAGLDEAVRKYPADVYISLDADLQHPVSFIPELVAHYMPGVHIVQAQRIDKNRKISLFKKFSSSAFYSVFSWLSGVKMQPGMSDFRLIDRYTLEFISDSRERDMFLRGLLPWSGLSTVMIPYTPAERVHGTSRYTLKKMLALSMSGIVGYSARPLYLAIVLGAVSLLLALLYFAYVITVTVTGQHVEIGWPSIVATVLALGGIQLFVIGILGIYLGKIFMEIKSRPTYVVGEKTS